MQTKCLVDDPVKERELRARELVPTRVGGGIGVTELLPKSLLKFRMPAQLNKAPLDR
jgi:hypothetical protein